MVHVPAGGFPLYPSGGSIISNAEPTGDYWMTGTRSPIASFAGSWRRGGYAKSGVLDASSRHGVG
jgi:hypothetical protein